MVVFICDACGDSVKKPAVEKHRSKCRNCYNLSCIDCNKDFPGEAYKEHTKCISEEEKYSGKDFVPRPSQNKGERKQDEWIEKVQAAIENSKRNPKLSGILTQIKKFDNIPRKKVKFVRFVENSLRFRNLSLINEAWDAINPPPQENTPIKENGTQISETVEKVENVCIESSSDDVKKLNKKERKALRVASKAKKEKKDNKNVNGIMDDITLKRKHDDNEMYSTLSVEKMDSLCQTEMTQIEGGSVPKSKKKKLSSVENIPNDTCDDNLLMTNNVHDISVTSKKKNQDLENGSSHDVSLFENTNHDISNISIENGNNTSKFNWEEIITKCLQKKKGELSLKKVQKKVFTEYWSINEFSAYGEKKAASKFQKAILKSTKLKLKQGIVYLL